MVVLYDYNIEYMTIQFASYIKKSKAKQTGTFFIHHFVELEFKNLAVFCFFCRKDTLVPTRGDPE